MGKLKMAGIMLSSALLAQGILNAMDVTGAKVTEDQVKEVLHVNCQSPAASDTANSGSEAVPFKTIQAAANIAAEKNKAGIGVKILVHPGTYREGLVMDYNGKETDAPVVIEAAEKGKVTVSGSDVWTGWVKQGDTRIFTHPWTHKWGLIPYPGEWEKYVVLQPICRRREMIFIDGKMLTQVLSPTDLKEGTFYVAEEKETAYIWPWTNVDIDKALIEVAVRDRLLGVIGKRNMVLRGIAFQHGNAACQGGAGNFANSHDILVEDCSFNWNNWSGFGFHNSKNITARRVHTNHNGGSGGGGSGLENIIWEDSEHNYNNWRGIMGGFDGWAVAGCKFLEINDGVFRRNKSVGNFCVGYWFDTACKNILVDEAYSTNNISGIFFEANQGPLELRNSLIAFNEKSGMISTNSSNITISGNVLFGNTPNQIWAGGTDFREWTNDTTKETFKFSLGNWTVKDNVIVCDKTLQNLINFPGWTPFISSLKAEGNLYFCPGKAKAFLIGNMELDLNDWQTVFDQDLNSIFAEPKFENPGKMQFALKSDSPVLKRSEWPKRKVDGNGLIRLKELKSKAIAANWARAYKLAEGTSDSNWMTVDFSKIANRAIEGAEGLVQGLNHFPAGLKKIHGVPFNIIDEKNNNGLATLALRSLIVKNSNGKPTPESFTIPINKQIKALYILHACGWGMNKHEKIGEYRLIYSDGTKHSVDLVTYGPMDVNIDVFKRLEKESNIQDWYPTATQFENDSARNVIISDPNNPLLYTRFLYTMQIVNPHPEKTVDAIVLSSKPDIEPSLYVLALTALQ